MPPPALGAMLSYNKNLQSKIWEAKSQAGAGWGRGGCRTGTGEKFEPFESQNKDRINDGRRRTKHRSMNNSRDKKQLHNNNNDNDRWWWKHIVMRRNGPGLRKPRCEDHGMMSSSGWNSAFLPNSCLILSVFPCLSGPCSSHCGPMVALKAVQFSVFLRPCAG